MIRQCLRKLAALSAACALALTAGMPALAAPTLDELEPGEYEVSSILLDVPALTEELRAAGYTAKLSGPDVSDDGTLLLKQGKLYSFVWEQTLPAGVYTTYGLQPQIIFDWVIAEFGSEYSQFIPLDGYSLFGFQDPDADMTIRVTFTDVYLVETNNVLRKDSSGQGPGINLFGSISLEVSTRIIGTFDLGDISQFESTAGVDDSRERIKRCAEENLILFAEPQELTCRLVENGSVISSTAPYGSAPQDTSIYLGYASTGYYETELPDRSYAVKTTDYSNQFENLDECVYCYAGIMTFRCLDWTLVPYSPGDFSYPDSGTLSAPDSSNVSAATAVAVTAGAGAAALGGSALSSVLSDTFASSAVNFSVPDTFSADPAVSAVPEADLPSDAKKKLLFGDEENEASKPKLLDGPDSEKDIPESDINAEMTEETAAPTLPEEDSPEVSMSLEAPGEDLLNIKGGAVNITVEIENGEGYVWHYIPAVITPGAAKAIIPTVIGHGSQTTLVLNITGAKTEERHHTVFVNLIAWTTTPDGKILKTSASEEMKLHAPGIEAKREKDGSLTVTAYADTTLKGYAEIRKLSAGEYTCTEAPDGKLTIQAVDSSLGSTTL